MKQTLADQLAAFRHQWPANVQASSAMVGTTGANTDGARPPFMEIAASARSPLPAMAVPRLWLVTKGRHRVRTAEGQEHMVVRGSLVALRPHAPWLADHATNYELLSVVFHEQFTRILARTNVGKIGWQPPREWTHLTGVGRQRERALLQAWVSESSTEVTQSIIDSLLQQVIWRLQNQAGEDTAENTHYRDACSFIQEHYLQEIDRQVIASVLGIHPVSLSRIFREHGGESCNVMIRRLRMAQAQAWLCDEPQVSIQSIAPRCGYHSTDHFIYDFRRHFGCSPGRWRQQQARGVNRDGE